MGKAAYRVLQVVAAMNRGGTETMLMNHYRALDRSKVQFDFLVHYQKEGAYDKEIEAMGGRIFRAPSIRPWSYIKYFNWLSKFFDEHHQDFIAVHGHIQENSGFALHYAKKHGIVNRLMSSHIAPMHIDYKYIFRQYAQSFCRRSATVRLACGVDAGKHLYGKSDFMVMRNAIDTDQFIFDPQKRKYLRDKLGVNDNDILIGHVGRFNPQKNHAFIIDVVSEAIKCNKKIRLALVGSGYLLDEIKKSVANHNIEDHVLFLGSRSDVNDLLQTFDVFFMPSRYEGLPVSVIEAQAAGLPCVLSDTIDMDCDVTGNVKFLSLTQPISDWCEAIEESVKRPRENTRDKICQSGYDVHENLKLLLPLYGINL